MASSWPISPCVSARTNRATDRSGSRSRVIISTAFSIAAIASSSSK